MLSFGALVWVSLRPLIRLVICVGCGFAITKADIFPVVAARGAGQLTLNIAMLCLMFSKIVPAFTPENISALGPLVLVAFIYEVIGISLALVIKQFFWVPHRFRYGIIVAGGWGNYADIPTSVVMSITASAPFAGTQDQSLAVAYVSAFILVFFFTLFPFGGHRMIAWDFIGPDVENDDARKSSIEKRRRLFKIAHRLLRILGRQTSSKSFPSQVNGSQSGIEPSMDPEAQISALQRPTLDHRRVSFLLDEPEVSLQDPQPHSMSEDIVLTPVTSPDPTVVLADTMTILETSTVVREVGAEEKSQKLSTSSPRPPSLHHLTLRHRVSKQGKALLSSLVPPPSISIIISFTIALVGPLKALFVPVPNSRIPNAPPLAFVQDAATFIGAASVPLGLMCLGSALARLKVPRNQWKSLPVGAITSLAVGKILLTPVILESWYAKV